MLVLLRYTLKDQVQPYAILCHFQPLVPFSAILCHFQPLVPFSAIFSHLPVAACAFYSKRHPSITHKQPEPSPINALRHIQTLRSIKISTSAASDIRYCKSLRNQGFKLMYRLMQTLMYRPTQRQQKPFTRMGLGSDTLNICTCSENLTCYETLFIISRV